MDKKGLSPVIASILLCAATLTVGIAAWSFTFTATVNLEKSYSKGVREQIEVISERFTVEHVSYDKVATTLHVWLYNFGKVDIEVDIYVEGDAKGQNATATPIAYGELVRVDVPLTAGEGVLSIIELAIKVMSRRQNFVYATYVVP